MRFVYKQKNKLLGLTALGLSACAAYDTPAPAACSASSLNDVQHIGSHNSYRRLPPSSVLTALDQMRPGLREKLEYEHPPLAAQLDLGLRLLELDFYADPEGGLYANPPNLDFLQEGDPLPFEADEINKPGFKVMHIQGYDNYAHCLHLRDCLLELKKWSDAHPDHELITVTMNIKEDRVFDDLPTPPKFDSERLEELDQLLLEAFGQDRLLTPDDVRGDEATLRGAVIAGGWPRLADTKQHFMFVLDEATPSASLVYREGHPSLRNRVMFARYPAIDDEAAFMVYWDISGHEQTVADLVAEGFLVRVSADIGTREARLNDRTRLEKAIRSGAQFIASDYYPGHVSPFETDYVARFEDGSIINCAP